MGGARVAALLAATLVMLIIVVAVAAPYMILVRIMEYSRVFNTMRTPRAKISEIYGYIKTGDLLLFVSATHLPANSGLCQVFFSHSAVLIREGDLVYTSEAQAGAELMPNPDRPGTDYHMVAGAAEAPLLPRIKFYTGVVYLLQLSRALDQEREQLLVAAAEESHRGRYAYPTTRQALAAALLGYKAEARHCFQHVAHLLDACRLTPLHRTTPLSDAGVLQVCRDVCAISQSILPDGYRYEHPIELVYDIGTLRLPGQPSAQDVRPPGGE